jgi:hypothetical protein
MATVTGFTAERMLVIENETVIDGEVQGDNLILQQRGGTQIDAGNVRGPKGDKGDTGTPGVVTSVNDLSIPAIYSPRQFDTKTDLDAWATAPVGSVAVVRDDTNTIWEKDSVGWFIVNGVRIFADVAERDARWVNPPNGSMCQAPIGTDFRRVNGAWIPYPFAPVNFYVGHNAQSIPAKVWTTITAWFAPALNEGGGTFSGGKYTFPENGRYFVHASILFAALPSIQNATYQFQFVVTGTPGPGNNGQTFMSPYYGGNLAPPPGTVNRYFYKGDTIAAQLYNGYTGAINTFGGYGGLTISKLSN